MEEKTNSLRKGGWQVNVKYFDDYVIKTPLTKEEIENKIYPYLKWKGELDKLDERVEKMMDQWKNSIEIVNTSNIPFSFLGNIIFLEGGKIKQDKVKIFKEIYSELADSFEENQEKIEDLINQQMRFVIELWKYGIAENTMKFETEYGLLGEDIVLIDFGELTDDYEKVKRQIVNNKPDLSKKKNYSDERVWNLIIQKRKEFLTMENLDRYWRKNID